MVEESRKKKIVLKEINHVFSIDPKEEDGKYHRDFRSIALCNTTYKIISKVIANQLKRVLNVLISEEQSTFSPARSILEGIIISYEAIHSTRKSKQVGMIIKLDIMKIYDLVDRGFLKEIFDKFGFTKDWIQ